MTKLYARKGAGSDAVEALLAAAGIPHEVEYLSKGADGHHPASFRAINPRGEVPTLVLDDGNVMTESAAILLWLADWRPVAGLAPGPGSRLRPRYLRWLTFLAASPYAAALMYYYPHRYTTEESGAAAIRKRAAEIMNRDFGIFADALGDGPFILGAQLSAADIYAAMLISWADDLPVLFNRYPNLQVLCDRVLAHPKIAPVWTHIEF